MEGHFYPNIIRPILALEGTDPLCNLYVSIKKTEPMYIPPLEVTSRWMASSHLLHPVMNSPLLLLVRPPRSQKVKYERRQASLKITAAH